MAIGGDFRLMPFERNQRNRVLFWHGRIDNVRELRARHSGCADDASDSPALITSVYERDGVAGLRDVIGDWCTVILDQRRAAIVFASDYSGTNPLYYCRRGDQVFWSTRIETVARRAGCTGLDEDYVATYLAHGGHERKTVWADVRVVPPGCAVTVTAAGERIAAFWSAPVHARTIGTEADYEARFRDLFTESVTARLQHSGTAIVELSGGLDSSSVACVATRLVRAGLVPAREIVTVSYVHSESTDLPFFRHVRSELGVRGFELSTERYPLATAQASATPSESWGALYSAVAAVADELQTRTILTGQGGDLVAGNFWDDSLQVAGALRRGRLAAAVKESVAWSRRTWRPAATILADAARVAFCPGHGRRLIEECAAPSGETSLSRACDSRARAAGQSCFDEWRDAPPERQKHFRQLSSMRRLRSLRPPEPLRGFDYGHPFMHRPLLEFLMTLPAHVLCGPGEPRLLMRKAFTGILHERVRRRRSKSLFGLPWLRALRPLALALLAAPTLIVVERGWVDADSVKRRLRRLVHGLDCNESQLRRIIMLECWLTSMASP